MSSLEKVMKVQFLNDDFLLVEVLTELRRRTSFMLAEQAVEIRERIEA